MALSYNGLLRELSTYDLNHLVAHLAASGRGVDIDGLHQLLWMHESQPGEIRVNAWYSAKNAAGQLDGYFEDIRLAARIAERQLQEQLAAGRLAKAALEVWRYALIEASVISMADNITPGMLTRFVMDGIWPRAQALAFARRVPEAGPRVAALAGLIELGGSEADTLTDEAVAIVRSIEQPLHRVRAAAALLAAVEDHRRSALFGETLEFMKEIEDESWRATTLVALAPALTSGEAEDALELLDDFTDDEHLAGTAAALVDRLPDSLAAAVLDGVPAADDMTREFVQRAVATLLPSGGVLDQLWCGVEGWRVRALTDTGTPLVSPLLEQCLVVAWNVEDPVSSAWTVAGLISYLSGEDRRRHLRDLLALMEANRHLPDVIAAVAAIESLLTDDERTRAFAIAAEEVSSPLAAQSLAKLARGIHEPLRGHTYTGMIRFLVEQASEPDAAEMIAVVAPHLPGRYLELAIRAAGRLRDPASAALALRAVAGIVPGKRTERLVRSAAAAAFAIDDERRRAHELIELAPSLPSDLVVKVHSAANEFSDESLGIELRSALLPYLPPHLVSQRFIDVMTEYAQGKSHPSQEFSKIVLAARLAPLLPASTVSHLMDVLGQLTNPVERVEALIELAPHATAANLELPDGFIGDVEDIKDPWRRTVSRVRLAKVLPEPQADPLYEASIAAALALASEEEPEEGLRRETLTVVAASLPARFRRRMLAVLPQLSADRDRERWMPDYLLTSGSYSADSFGTEMAPAWSERAAVLAALADGWPATGLDVLATAAQRIGDVNEHAQALLALRDLLPAKPLTAQIARLLLASDDGDAVGNWFPLLATGPFALSLDDVLDAVRKIASVPSRARALATCAQSAEVMDAIPDAGWRAYAYGVSGVTLDPDRLENAAHGVWQLDNQIMRSIALEAIAPRLTDQLMREAISRAVALDDHRLVGLTMAKLAGAMSESMALEIYRYGQSQTDHARRFAIVAQVAGRLPAMHLDAALADLLQAADSETRRHVQRGLESMSQHLPAGKLGDVLANAATLNEPGWRAKVMVALLPGLLTADLADGVSETLSAVMSLEAGSPRDHLLHSFVSALPAGWPEQGMEAVRAITDPELRLHALQSLADRVPEPDRRQVVADVQRGFLLKARAETTDSGRCLAIARCTGTDPDSLDTAVVLELVEITTSMTDPRERSQAIAACAPALARAAKDAPAAVWLAARPRRETSHRADLVKDLSTTTPVLLALAGDAAAADIADLLLYLAECWP